MADLRHIQHEVPLGARYLLTLWPDVCSGHRRPPQFRRASVTQNHRGRDAPLKRRSSPNSSSEHAPVWVIFAAGSAFVLAGVNILL